MNTRLAVLAVIGICQAATAVGRDIPGSDYRDALDKAVSLSKDVNVDLGTLFQPFVGDQYTYDSNLFRLPSDLDVKTIVGPDASRGDHYNSASAGLYSQWLLRNQALGLQLRVDDNRFGRNSNLNNVSAFGKAIYDWTLGSALAGKVGADFNRGLIGFVNSTSYQRNIVNQSDWYTSVRYQVGPRWALYAGVLGGRTTFTSPGREASDSTQKSAQGGVEYATGPDDSVAFEYRFADVRYSRSIELNGQLFDPDYRDLRARALFKYALSEKTWLDAAAGYLKRNFPNSAVASFSGEIGRFDLGWQPTDKVTWVLAAWRDLGSYLTSQTDYFISSAASISPIWQMTDKLKASALVSYDNQRFVGSSPVALVTVARRDRVASGGGSLIYSPLQALDLTFTIRRDQHHSNVPRFGHDDTLTAVAIQFRF